MIKGENHLIRISLFEKDKVTPQPLSGLVAKSAKILLRTPHQKTLATYVFGTDAEIRQVSGQTNGLEIEIKKIISEQFIRGAVYVELTLDKTDDRFLTDGIHRDKALIKLFDIDDGLVEGQQILGTYSYVTQFSPIVSVEPTVQVTDFVTTLIQQTSSAHSWTLGNGAFTLILAKAGGAVDADPVDGETYTAGAFGAGSEIGTGNFVVFKGAAALATITGLTANTVYHLRAYTFSGTSGQENYLSTAAPTLNFTTATSLIENLSLVNASGILSPSYTLITGTESNKEPYVLSIKHSGTKEVGQVQTIDMEFANPSIYGDGNHIVSVYRATNKQGSGLTFVQDITSYVTVGTAKRFTYTAVTDDGAAGFLLFVGKAVLDGGSNDESIPFDSDFIDISFPSRPLNAFSEVSSDFSDWTFASGSDGAAFVSGVNQGSWGPPVIGHVNAPTLSTAEQAMRFTKANGEAIKFSKPEALGSPYQMCFVIKLPANATTRHICGFSGSKLVRIGTDEVITVNATTTTDALTEETWQAVRIQFGNGIDSSFVQIGTGVKSLYNFGDTGVGSGLVNVWFGSRSDTTNSLEGFMKAMGVKNGTVSDAEWADIVAEYTP